MAIIDNLSRKPHILDRVYFHTLTIKPGRNRRRKNVGVVSCDAWVMDLGRELDQRERRAVGFHNKARTKAEKRKTNAKLPPNLQEYHD